MYSLRRRSSWIIFAQAILLVSATTEENGGGMSYTLTARGQIHAAPKTTIGSDRGVSLADSPPHPEFIPQSQRTAGGAHSHRHMKTKARSAVAGVVHDATADASRTSTVTAEMATSSVTAASGSTVAGTSASPHPHQEHHRHHRHQRHHAVDSATVVHPIHGASGSATAAGGTRALHADARPTTTSAPPAESHETDLADAAEQTEAVPQWKARPAGASSSATTAGGTEARHTDARPTTTLAPSAVSHETDLADAAEQTEAVPQWKARPADSVSDPVVAGGRFFKDAASGPLTHTEYGDRHYRGKHGRHNKRHHRRSDHNEGNDYDHNERQQTAAPSEDSNHTISTDGSATHVALDYLQRQRAAAGGTDASLLSPFKGHHKHRHRGAGGNSRADAEPTLAPPVTKAAQDTLHADKYGGVSREVPDKPSAVPTPAVTSSDVVVAPDTTTSGPPSVEQPLHSHVAAHVHRLHAHAEHRHVVHPHHAEHIRHARSLAAAQDSAGVVGKRLMRRDRPA